MIRNIFCQTINFKNKPKIIGSFSLVGPKEGEGIFGDWFDFVMEDDKFGEDSYEKTERKMLETAINGACKKAKIDKKDISAILSGDLLNQIISSSYAAREFDSIFLGVFGACSTMVESLALGSCLVDGGYFDHIVCATASHFSTAERQFRFPLELGNQRPPTSQWTVTGAAGSVLSTEGRGPVISCATFGKVQDYGICDVNNMGAAMAPAAMSTILAHFKDTKTKPSDYDLILTGDLGKHGSEVLIDLLEEKGVKMGSNYGDCGQMYFNKNQRTFMGASGPGCCATVLNSYVVDKIRTGEYKKVLFVATGALLSTVACQQGESIPCIAHAIVIEGGN